MIPCHHKVKKAERSVMYERAKGLRRREYRCLQCDAMLPPTYEGSIEDLEAWIKPAARKEALRDAVGALSRL